jgi:hypothetical protein
VLWRGKKKIAAKENARDLDTILNESMIERSGELNKKVLFFEG